MSWNKDFSEETYQHYWGLSPEDRQQHIDDHQTPTALKALLLYQQGTQCFERNQLGIAIACFDQALSLQPRWHGIWTSRAVLLLQTCDYDATIASCDRALELEPTDDDAWSIQGTALYHLRRYKEAVSHCNRALALNSKNYQAWRTLSDALSYLAHYEEAVASYNKALDLQPNDPRAWGDRGTALQKLRQYEAAIASYDKLLEFEPKNYKFWHQRGLGLRRLGRFKEALTNFDRALEIQPDFYAATRSKLFLLIKTGQIFSYLFGRKSLVERKRLLNDLQNLVNAFIKFQLPAMVVIFLVVLASTRDLMAALIISAILLMIAVVGDLFTDARR